MEAQRQQILRQFSLTPVSAVQQQPGTDYPQNPIRNRGIFPEVDFPGKNVTLAKVKMHCYSLPQKGKHAHEQQYFYMITAALLTLWIKT